MAHSAFVRLACAVLVAVCAAPALAAPEAVYDTRTLRDGACMRTWLLCGPFPNPLRVEEADYFHNDNCVGYFKDYLATVGGESAAKPTAGMKVSPEGVEARTWWLYQSPRDAIAFDEVLKPSETMVGYAACVIRSDRDQSRLFGLGSNDGVRLWLNGREVWRFHGPRSVEVDDDYIRLPLRKGINRLLIKVDNGHGRWGFQLRPVTGAMARAFLLQNAATRLALDISYSDGRVHARFGAARRTAAVPGLPAARVVVRTVTGKPVRTLTMALGREYTWSNADFPEREYLLAAELRIPGGKPYRVPGYFATYDVVGAARKLLAADFPKPPPSRRAEVTQRLIEHLRWWERVGRADGEMYAYRRTEIGLGRIREQLAALAAESATPYDGLIPTPRSVKQRAGEECAIKAGWRLSAPDSILPVASVIPFLAAWQRRFGDPLDQTPEAGPNTIAVRVVDDPSASDVPAALLAQVPPSREGYVLEIGADRVTIVGRTRAAAFYGLDTFGQLVEQDRRLPCATVTDWPRYPLRSVCEIVDPTSADFRRDVEQYARLRYNQVTVGGDYGHLDDPTVAAKLREAFAYCRDRFIQPLPSIETFGGGSIATAVDPDMVEGVFRQRVRYTVGRGGTVRIPGPRILDTVTARPTVWDASGRELRQGVDYTIVTKEPPVIRFRGAAAKAGSRVRISYDLVDFASFRFPATCPSDERRWPYIDKVIGGIFRKLKADSIHLGQDEGGYMNRDSRCLARKTTARKLMADQFRRTYDIVRKHNPKAEVYLWADEFNPWQNAPNLGGPDSARDLPKDVVVMDWWYAGQRHDTLEMLERSARFFADLGIRVATASWDDPFNTVHLARMGNEIGDRYVGLVHTFWGGYTGCRELTAQGAWQGTTMLGDFAY